MLTELKKFLDLGVDSWIDDDYVQLFVTPELREQALTLVIAAEASGYSTHQIANDHGSVTLTITKDPRILE